MLLVCDNDNRNTFANYSCGIDFIEGFVNASEQGWQANYGSRKLHSHFQAIYSLAHQEVVGYEGLLRAHDQSQNPVPPSELFAERTDLFDSVFLDRLSRYLHVSNFTGMKNDNDWLFLNVSPKVVVSGKLYGDFFHALLARTGMDPRRVVVEIVEDEIGDEDKLAEAVEYYRGLGCLIAIDDFGKGHSNFNRIWQLQPEIVKLDQSFIQQATANINARRILTRLVSLIHESGSLVLLEGVETESEALLAIDSGTDFVQGYYFSRSNTGLIGTNTSFQQLCHTYRSHTDIELQRSMSISERYQQTLQQSAQTLSQGEAIETACRALLALPYVQRCYLLDHDGWLIQHCAVNKPDNAQGKSRFTPLNRNKGMVWSQWREILKAWNNNGQVYTGKPHLSIKDSVLCRTLSITLEVDGKELLLNCDIDAIGFDHADDGVVYKTPAMPKTNRLLSAI